ncbi:MAG: type III secretion system stalk subunit SctO [Gammaproteobacteria bacterium]
MLDELLKIKRLREDDAISKLVKAEALLEQRKKEKQAKEQELIDYREWRIKREEELYQEVEGKQLEVGKLVGIREHIASLRAKELAIEEELSKAKKAQQEAEQGVEDAKQVRLAAYREVTKYEEYIEKLKREEELEQERYEEKETEDLLTGRK